MVSIELNANILAMEYAVRGPIPQRAAEMTKAGQATIPCNIGNPQALGQPPLSWFRQVSSVLEDPNRLKEDTLDPEVARTAQRMLEGFGGTIGAYSDSRGPQFVREAVAAFIDKRDGSSRQADPEQIFLTNGASEAVRYLMEMLITRPEDGIMIPIPQYPLYSASIRKCGGRQVDYYPDEEGGWSLGREELERSYAAAVAAGTRVQAIVAIHPGNPSGAILPGDSVREVLDFAKEKQLCVIADEVYQDNLYGGEFTSFAKALGDETEVPLFSLHSTSKGFFGECGHRGGYVEVRNPPELLGRKERFLDVLFKQASVNLCSNTLGQALTYLMVQPPAEGSDARRCYDAEREHILSELETKARKIRAAFDEMDGVRCFGQIGAMYLFPRLDKLPSGVNDFDYCMSLLEETGLCTVNGSGFGQRPGSSHLRIAFLPPRALLEEVLPRWIDWHNRFVNS
ncbi:MAG: aminotransferase class I/II [Planctomycetota bacterium]|nr:MAG: aminotransferase class I/II [Planctomycetota bacterium]